MPPFPRSASKYVSVSRPRFQQQPHLTLRLPIQRRIHLDTASDAVTLAADAISSIHAAGIPWYMSISLVAIGVNFSFRLPIQFYARRLVVRRQQLNPLISAWTSVHAATVSRSGTPEQVERYWRLRLAGLTERTRKRIYRTWGVQRWKLLAPFLSMVPFVVVSEALRRLCGAPRGFISHYMGLDGAGGLSADLFDPDLVQGGCLWFMDLTAMDPYYVLPLLCSTLLARTTYRRISDEQMRALIKHGGPRTTKTPMMKIQSSIARALLLVPLLPIFFADMPSAIFVYWATAFALNDVNESILERRIPKPEPRLKLVQRKPSVRPFLR